MTPDKLSAKEIKNSAETFAVTAPIECAAQILRLLELIDELEKKVETK